MPAFKHNGSSLPGRDESCTTMKYNEHDPHVSISIQFMTGREKHWPDGLYTWWWCTRAPVGWWPLGWLERWLVGEERRGFEFVELARLLEAASAGRHSSEITIGQPVTLDMNIGV